MPYTIHQITHPLRGKTHTRCPSDGLLVVSFSSLKTCYVYFDFPPPKKPYSFKKRILYATVCMYHVYRLGLFIHNISISAKYTAYIYVFVYINI
jgi:hypothetical protein